MPDLLSFGRAGGGTFGGDGLLLTFWLLGSDLTPFIFNGSKLKGFRFSAVRHGGGLVAVHFPDGCLFSVGCHCCLVDSRGVIVSQGRAGSCGVGLDGTSIREISHGTLATFSGVSSFGLSEGCQSVTASGPSPRKMGFLRVCSDRIFFACSARIHSLDGKVTPRRRR